jgi:NitT/TauT family transport system substrate-binding protein
MAARLKLFVCLFALAVSCIGAQAQQLTVAVGGRSFLGYLPLAIAQQLNYFKDEGLDVQVNDFASGR